VQELLRRRAAPEFAVGLWFLKIKRNHVGAGFPRPIASITDLGGENPPLRWIAWLHLIIKDHQPTVGVIIFPVASATIEFSRGSRDVGTFAGRPVVETPRL